MRELDLALDISSRLGQAGFRHLVGGSIASGVWGQPRTTNDADIEIWLSTEDLSSLAQALEDPYYFSHEEAQNAIEQTEPFGSFQVLHMDEAFKFDLFIVGTSPIDGEAHQRVIDVRLPDGRSLPIACPEHIFVQKLRWYELSHRTSERQWRDLVEIARVTKALDRELVLRWSQVFDLHDLAREMLSEADALEA